MIGICINALATITGYLLWLLVIVAVIFSLFINKISGKEDENVSATELNSMKILIKTVANNMGIAYEAAEDLIEYIQELLYEHRAGMGNYTSEEEILSDFGINPTLLWVFD